MKYEYVECGKNNSQYEGMDISGMVDARYIPATLENDRGNPFIEALPLPRKEGTVIQEYTTYMVGYSPENAAGESKLAKMLEVGLLKEIRFPLTFNKKLEFMFYDSLLTSYRERERMKAGGKPVKYTADDRERKSDSILTGDPGAATNAGFSLIGYSGCGKSSALKILLSRYPQVILHKDEKGTFPQITYIVVNCTPNSNFSALYEGIGDAIDKALGNITPTYADEVRKARTLAGKAEKIRQYVETFAIGILIVDEIQNCSFERMHEGSFESLLALANRTKVAIAVIGTEDAREKMFPELRTARRMGKTINGNFYCTQKKFFKTLVEKLLRYQWFDTKIKATDEIVDTLFDVTKGIIDQLISVYSCVCYEYLEKWKPEEKRGENWVEPKIDGEFIRNAAKKYYPNLQDVLSHLGESGMEEEMAKMKERADEMVAAMLDEEEQAKQMNSIIDAGDETGREQLMLEYITANIPKALGFTAKEIEGAYRKAISGITVSERTEEEITRMVIKELLNNTGKAEKKQDKPKRKANKGKVKIPGPEMILDYTGVKKGEETAC